MEEDLTYEQHMQDLAKFLQHTPKPSWEDGWVTAFQMYKTMGETKNYWYRKLEAAVLDGKMERIRYKGEGYYREISPPPEDRHT